MNAPPRSDLDGWARMQSPIITGPITDFPLKGVIADTVAKNLSISKLHRATGIEAPNHAKIYIVDDASFYVGSDNFYTSGHTAGLQEFGYLVEDAAEARKFRANYWDKAWKFSESLPVRALIEADNSTHFADQLE